MYTITNSDETVIIIIIIIIITPLFQTIVDNPQLHNKLPRRTAQIQLNTKNQS